MDGMDLTGKVALVTGGAVRVGRAVSLALAAAGCDLFVHYGRSAESAAATRREAEALGVRVGLHAADLADPEAAVGVVRAARREMGRVDILVNSAGVFAAGDLAETTLAVWERQFAVNLRTPFLLSRELVAGLEPDGRARIVNILDARIFRPAGDHFAYRLSKSALHAMTGDLARALAPRVTVNAVAPGAILPPPGEAPGYLARLAAERVPLGVHGSPEQVAESVLHLLRGDFLTGVTIRLDGGEFL